MTQRDQTTANEDGDTEQATTESSRSFTATLSENSGGMLADFIFAVVWVGMVTFLVELLQGPQWALYLMLAAGIPAYFIFFWSLNLAREQQS